MRGDIHEVGGDGCSSKYMIWTIHMKGDGGKEEDEEEERKGI